MTKRLFIGKLSYETTNNELEDLFAQVGQVVSAKIITDKYTGQSKGFGFVEMNTEEEAQKAIQTLNGTSVKGRTIIVSEAKPMEERGGGGFGGGGGRGGFTNNRSERGGRRDFSRSKRW